jgi:recombination DNA repair RAD52 pathway protein
MMAFTEAQVKNLEAKLDSKHVRMRKVEDTTLAYVEGWHVIAEANRIFGYDAWDRHSPRAVFGQALQTTTMAPPISPRSA